MTYAEIIIVGLTAVILFGYVIIEFSKDNRR